MPNPIPGRKTEPPVYLFLTIELFVLLLLICTMSSNRSCYYYWCCCSQHLIIILLFRNHKVSYLSKDRSIFFKIFVTTIHTSNQVKSSTMHTSMLLHRVLFCFVLVYFFIDTPRNLPASLSSSQSLIQRLGQI